MTVWSDLRHGARLLAKDRGLSVAAIGAMALAMAAVATIATLANGIFFRPLPFDAPDRIVLVDTNRTSGSNVIPAGLSYLEWQEWRAASRTFTDLAVFGDDTVTLADDRIAPERLDSAIISANTFALIGRSPMLGRDFTASDDTPGAAPVAILGHGIWQTRYGGDRSVIGRGVRVNGRQATIVGVMPAGFAFPQTVDIWQPLAAMPEARRSSRAERVLEGIGRMRPGVSRAQAMGDLTAVAAGIATRDPATSAGVTPRVRDFRERSVGRVRIVFTAFGAAAGFVLLVACANVANLLLARGLERTREMSIRLSMGASRAQIAGQLLTESAVLGVVAGAAGLAFSAAGVAAFRGAMDAAGNVPYWIEFPIDWRVLGFLAAVSLLSSALFGLVPALQTTRVSLTAVLADGGWTATGTAGRRRWQGAFVTAQIALAIVLLTIAGLALRDLQATTRVDAGIETSSVTTARFLLPETRYPSPEARAAFYRRLDARLPSLAAGPSVLAMYPPSRGAEPRYAAVDGQPVPNNGRRVSFLSVGPRYFATLSTRPVRGRELSDTDGPDIAVVNERFAELYFAGVDPIGRDVRLGGFPPTRAAHRVTVVGVAPNVRHRSTEDHDFDPAVYVAQAAEAPPFATLIIRSRSGTAAAASAMREVMRALDPDLALYQMASVDALLDEERWEGRMLSTVFGLIAALALALAAIGVYGVTAFAVTKRTREIGLRLALGARAGHILALVIGGAGGQIALGTVLGLAGAVALGRILQNLLSEVEPSDPVTLVAVPLVLAAVAAVACAVPAARAMRVDPARALRAD